MSNNNFLCLLLLAAAVAVCVADDESLGGNKGADGYLLPQLDSLNENAAWLTTGHEPDGRSLDWEGPKNGLNLVRFLNGRYYHRQYNKINEQLLREVGSQDVWKNMAKLDEWYQEERQKGSSSGAYVEALKQLLSLKEITDTNRCNRNTYTILYKNDRATGGRTHMPHMQMGVLSHVDLIVEHFAWKHAQDCYYNYPQRFRALRDSSLEPFARTCVDAFTKPLIEASDRSITKITNKDAGAVAWQAIDALAQDDPDRQYLGRVMDEAKQQLVIKTDKLAGLVNKYLVEPCRKYTNLLGPDVYIPYNYDQQMFSQKERSLEGKNSRQEIQEFSDGWLAYRLCEALVVNREGALPAFLFRYINEELPSDDQ